MLTVAQMFQTGSGRMLFDRRSFWLLPRPWLASFRGRPLQSPCRRPLAILFPGPLKYPKFALRPSVLGWRQLSWVLWRSRFHTWQVSEEVEERTFDVHSFLMHPAEVPLERTHCLQPPRRPSQLLFQKVGRLLLADGTASMSNSITESTVAGCVLRSSPLPPRQRVTSYRGRPLLRFPCQRPRP